MSSLWGWFVLDEWQPVIGRGVPMAPSTALVSLLLGLVVGAGLMWAGRPLFRYVVFGVAAVAVVVSLLVLAGSFGIVSLAWEYRLAGVDVAVAGLPFGLMSPITAVLFVLLAAGLIALFPPFVANRAFRRTTAIVMLAGAIFSGLTGLAYITGVPLFYGPGIIPMAFSTAVALTGLFMGVFLSGGATELFGHPWREVQGRLVLGLGAVVGLLILVAAMAYVGLSGMRRSQHALLAGPFTNVVDLKSFQVNVTAGRLAVAVMLELPPATWEPRLEEVDALARANDEILRRVGEGLADNPAARKKLEEIVVALAAYRQGRHAQVLDLLSAGHVAEARAIFVGPQLERFRRLQELVQQLESIEIARAREIVATADHRARAFVGLFAGAGSLSILGAIMLGFFLRRTVGGYVAERQRAEHALLRANRALRIVSSCNQALVRAPSESALLRDICETIVREGGYRMVWIGFADNDPAKTVRPAAQAGAVGDYLTAARITWADTPAGRGPTGNAIRTGRPSLCRDMRHDPDFAPWRERALARGFASSAVLPLLAEGRVFGALSIYAAAADAFGDDDVKLLSELADDVAHGILVHRIRDERQQAQSALRAAAAYNRSLIEASLDPLVTIGPDGRISDVNAATEKATGRRRSELVGTDFSTYFTAPEKARAGYQQVFREGLVRDYPLELRHADGRVTSVLYNASVYRNEAGEIAGVFAAARDLTELQRAEAEVRALNATLEQRVQARTRELRESEERLRAVLRATATGTFEVDLTTGEGRWNDVEYELLGLKPGEVPPGPESFFRHVHADDLGPLNAQWEEAMRSGRLEAEFRVVYPDGEVRWLAGKGHFVEGRAGGAGGKGPAMSARFLGVNYDITARKHAEQALRESEQRLNTAIRAAAAGVWDWDIATGRLQWSQEMFRMFGLDPATTPATFETWRQSVHPADRAAAEARVHAALRSHTRLENEYRVLLPSGETRWIVAMGDATDDSAGQPRRMTGVCIDITARKKAELELRQLAAELKAANAELEAFSYSVSHDLRAPLRSIDGFSRIVLENSTGKLDPEDCAHLQRVRAASQRMGELIDALLKLSRAVRAEMRCVTLDVSALARNTLEELQRAEPGRQVECVVAPGLRATADRPLLHLVLENLLGNAWKFTANCPAARIEFGGREAGGEHVLFVRDNGAGFDPAYAAKLFAPFQRLHTQDEFPGQGIGLATVQRIIRRHGGRVWAEGAVNSGATFYFTLPVQPAKP
ncbi:MAG TPA: PAS domain-containing protein [Lacunisphaera sp.]|nr:PAS domain-containing protein [Lacunisphaera sp.]